MKNKLSLAFCTFVLIAHSSFAFAQFQQDEPPQDPDAPPVLDLQSGICAPSGTVLMSCLTCQSTAPTPQPQPQLSTKAEKLLQIMTVGCSISNRSDPRNYVSPTNAQLRSRLSACTAEVYPETAMSTEQQKSVTNLRTNRSVQHKVFSSLYYPHRERAGFETYFGLDIKDARYLFCHGQPHLLGPIYPIEYYEAWYEDRPYTLPSEYVKANKYREQLRSCISPRSVAKRAHSSHMTSANPETCTWETGQGIMSVLVNLKVSEWLAQGQPVFIESEAEAVCARVPNVEFLAPIKSFVKIATVKCVL